MINRILIPLGESELELRGGNTRHAIKDDMKAGKIVLVSNCAHWKLDDFDLLIGQVKALVEHAEWEYAGALLRPHGEIMKPIIESGVAIDDIFEASIEAGRQMIKNGRMQSETLNAVSRVLVPIEQYVS